MSASRATAGLSTPPRIEESRQLALPSAHPMPLLTLSPRRDSVTTIDSDGVISSHLREHSQTKPSEAATGPVPQVTIDLRDQPGSANLRGLRAWVAARRVRTPSAGVAVLRRVIIADLVAGAIALEAALEELHYGFVGWALLVPVLWPVALINVGAYDRRRLLTYAVTPSTLVGAASQVVVATAVAGLVVDDLNVRQSLRLTGFLLAGTIVTRWVVSQWLTRRRRTGHLLVPVLARGRAADLHSFMNRVSRDPAPIYEVVAAQSTDLAPLDELLVATRVPQRTDPVDAAVRNGVSAVVMVGPTDLPSDAMRRMIWRCQNQGIDTWMLPIIEPVAPPTVSHVHRGGLPSMVFQGPNRQLFAVKRIMDRVLAAVGLFLLLPVLLAIALLIRRDSPGPALFRQTRVGRDGRQFTMLKFRTMCADAEARRAALAEQNAHAGGTLFKIRQDPRITSIGRILRKYSIDEIPQLINVLRGEMSLVGPRPALPDEVANYPVDSMRRFTVNPGLTGLWQVSGRSNLDPEESARLDTVYVEHWSMGLDVRILARTAKVVLTSEGSY